MVLERRTPGSQVWKPVLVADVRHGGVRATVQLDERAFYRWRFVERPLAEGNASMSLLLDVLPTLPTDPPTSTPSPTPSTPSPDGLTVRPVVALEPGVDGHDHRVAHRTCQRTGQRVGDRE